MPGRCSAGSADSTRDSEGLGFDTSSSVSRILGDAESSRSGSPAFRAYMPYRTLMPDGSVQQGYAERTVIDALHGPTGNKEPLIFSCGGFPCQDLSVAGRRAGLTGARSSLFFEFARVADELVPADGWILVENVPGLLSSNNGRDFAVVLATLADLGFHDLAWRILDSRHFGVPQRRRRVFVVGRRARGDSACQVLLEPESGGGHFARAHKHGAGSLPSTFAVSDSGADGGAANSARTQKRRRREAQQTDDRWWPTRSTKTRRNRARPQHQLRQLRRRTQQSGAPIRGRGAYPQAQAGGQRRADGQAPHPRRVRTPPSAPRQLDEGTGRRPRQPPLRRPGDAVTASVAEWIGRRILAS